MNLRESLAKNPALAKAVAIVVVFLAGGLIFLETRSNNRIASTSGNPNAFFSVDDGKTWFTDTSTNVPPYEKNGKQALQAVVYRCPDGPKFVGYLQRFTPAAKHALEVYRSQDPAKQKSVNPAMLRQANTVGRQVKRPGDVKWISCANIMQAAKVTQAQCPHGGGAPVEVEP